MRAITRNANAVTFVAGGAVGSVLTVALNAAGVGHITDYDPFTSLVVIALALWAFMRTEHAWQGLKTAVIAMSEAYSQDDMERALDKFFAKQRRERDES